MLPYQGMYQLSIKNMAGIVKQDKNRMLFRVLFRQSDKMSNLQDTWDGHLVRLSAYKTVPKLFEMTINSRIN